ncbi:hypothetical protein TPA0910_19700 [Streptomyces hygroscopicus subsp. sporocinereus]|uniref:Uncharacterized protein n=1 Tax=Streptomyces hygroscopicus TaxID=1912 RepID=A0ABQ3TW21_STRHY|nr:hypothetical protein TPA0910_19700 [Streptomyces hygroscopicus]
MVPGDDMRGPPRALGLADPGRAPSARRWARGPPRAPDGDAYGPTLAHPPVTHAGRPGSRAVTYALACPFAGCPGSRTITCAGRPGERTFGPTRAVYARADPGAPAGHVRGPPREPGGDVRVDPPMRGPTWAPRRWRTCGRPGELSRATGR